MVIEEKISRIREAIAEHGSVSLRMLKDVLGDGYIYSEIRFVVEGL